MQVKKYDGSDVRRILVGMITDRTVCARVSGQWKLEGLFDSDWANLIGGLIVDYFRKYSECPKNSIQTIFENWASSTNHSEKNVESVERFLQGVSDEADGHQDATEHILDIAGEYFNKVHLERELEAAKLEIRDHRIEEAQERVQKLQRVNLGVGSYIRPANDVEVWVASRDVERDRPLVTYRQELGDFMGNAFQRGRFFAFMAPDKTGKTAWLIDFLYIAARAKQRVAFFDAGDAIEEDFMDRLGMRVTGKPLFDCSVQYPTGWNDSGVELEERNLKTFEPVSAYRQLQKICGRGGSEDKIRTMFHPSSSFGADDLDSILGDWDREGWRPDVVIVDYADILAPPRGVRDSLDQIDETWKRLRRISQKRHCLMITATQSSAAVYGKESGLIGREHFSGRKTKLAHVSGMIGINVTNEEREQGLCRINKFAWRHGKNNEKAYVQVAGCYEIGRPAVISRWPQKS